PPAAVVPPDIAGNPGFLVQHLLLCRLTAPGRHFPEEAQREAGAPEKHLVSQSSADRHRLEFLPARAYGFDLLCLWCLENQLPEIHDRNPDRRRNHMRDLHFPWRRIATLSSPALTVAA